MSEINALRMMPRVSIAEDAFFGDGLMNSIMEGAKVTIGRNAAFRGNCSLLVHSGATLTISDNVFFNNFCSVNCLGSIAIGENTIFGEGVRMYDHNHKNQIGSSGALEIETQEFSIGSISVGKNCWIGSNVTILNNVEIGDNVLIGANCLIYKSIPSNSIVKHKEELFIETKL